MSSKTNNLYVRANIVVRPHDSETSEVYNLNDRTQQMVPKSLLSLLANCNEARSLEGHCSHIRDVSPNEGDDKSVIDSLKNLINRGLLRRVTLPEPSSSTQSQRVFPPPDTHRDIEVIIPTVGRPLVTARLLRSLRDSATDGQPAPVHIVLDSENPHTRRDVTEAVSQSLSSESPITWRISDRADRRNNTLRLAKALALSRDETDALVFGLLSDQALGVTLGTPHNYGILSSSRSTVISIDDDVICSGVTGNIHRVPRISTTAHITLRYSRDRSELLQKFEVGPVDIEKFASGVLDTTLSGINSSYGALDWRPSEVTPDLWYRLERYNPTVDAVVVGHLGDSAVGAAPALPSAAVGIPQLFGNDNEQVLALYSKEMMRVADFPTITTQPFFMTTVFALSLNRILPPFFPFGRGHDWVFGNMVTRLFEDSLIGHIPIALLHDPQDGRANRLERPPDRITHGINRLLLMIVTHYAKQTTGGSREDRLIDFGQWLREHAEQKPEMFRSWVTEIACKALTQYGEGIDRSYPGARGTDSPLGRTVTNLLADIERRVKAQDIGPIVEYAALGLGEAEAFEQMAHHFSLFGTFVELWPAIWAERSVLWNTEM